MIFGCLHDRHTIVLDAVNDLLLDVGGNAFFHILVCYAVNYTRLVFKFGVRVTTRNTITPTITKLATSNDINYFFSEVSLL